MSQKLTRNLPKVNRDLPSSCEVSFFVPCLNEEKNIAATLENIFSVCARLGVSYEVLIFDDASTDRTVDEALRFHERHPDATIRIFCNAKRGGLARNYVDGAYVAEGRYYLLVNGDNAEPPASIEAILKERGKADMIIPVFAGNDQRTFKRRLLSTTFTAIVNAVSGNRVRYYNGPVLHRRYNVLRWHADTDGFAYQAEIITRLIQEGVSYREVVITNQDRMFGRSSALNLKNFLAISHSLFQILCRRARHAMFYKDKAAPAASSTSAKSVADSRN